VLFGAPGRRNPVRGGRALASLSANTARAYRGAFASHCVRRSPPRPAGTRSAPTTRAAGACGTTGSPCRRGSPPAGRGARRAAAPAQVTAPTSAAAGAERGPRGAAGDLHAASRLLSEPDARESAILRSVRLDRPLLGHRVQARSTGDVVRAFHVCAFSLAVRALRFQALAGHPQGGEEQLMRYRRAMRSRSCACSVQRGPGLPASPRVGPHGRGRAAGQVAPTAAHGPAGLPGPTGGASPRYPPAPRLSPPTPPPLPRAARAGPPSAWRLPRSTRRTTSAVSTRPGPAPSSAPPCGASRASWPSVRCVRPAPWTPKPSPPFGSAWASGPIRSTGRSAWPSSACRPKADCAAAKPRPCCGPTWTPRTTAPGASPSAAPGWPARNQGTASIKGAVSHARPSRPPRGQRRPWPGSGPGRTWLGAWTTGGRRTSRFSPVAVPIGG